VTFFKETFNCEYFLYEGHTLHADAAYR